MNGLSKAINKVPLIGQIAIGLVIGVIIATALPAAVPFASIFGDLFVKALKGIAPVLVFILVTNAMLQRKSDGNSRMKPVITLYVLGTFAASLVGVALSFLFIGILAWAIIIGLALHKTADTTTKAVFESLAKGITQVVAWVIRFAPLGIMGLVTQSISASGLSALLSYVQLLGVLLGSYFLVALIMNPLIVYAYVHKNPYPLVWATLRESGIYAFFTRSSAANIPVNLSLCKRLGLNPDTYAISIPLGATINMAGASITISVLALAAANTLNIQVDLLTALLLCIVSTVGACGASGVAGGSLLLIPVACASFGIGNDIAMQVVGVGFIISVLEDACETALNSSSDVLFTATAEYAQRAKEGTLRAEDMVPKE